jgi:hypothetical protein
MSTVSLNRRLWAQVYREIFSGVCGRTYTSEENTADNESGLQGSGEGFSGRVANCKSKLGSKGYCPISLCFTWSIRIRNPIPDDRHTPN